MITLQTFVHPCKAKWASSMFISILSVVLKWIPALLEKKKKKRVVWVHRPVKVNYTEGLGHVHLEDQQISNMASWKSMKGRSNPNHRVLHQTQEVYTELMRTQNTQVSFVLKSYKNHLKKGENEVEVETSNLPKQQLYCQFDTSNRYKSVTSRFKWL